MAREAIAWGEPVLSSSITDVSGGRLYYRGADATVLARTQTLEAVALRLWACDDDGVFAREPRPRVRLKGTAPGAGVRRPGRAGGHRRPGARPLAPGAVARRGGPARRPRRALGEGVGEAQPLHVTLARAWGLGAIEAEIVRRALVLMADHELNASTFAVRVAASTAPRWRRRPWRGWPPCRGPHHGGAAARTWP